jgi:2-dehydropantoate 2-reductase
VRIAVVGSGGVGGYFGGRLAASGADVVFLARGAHKDALLQRGLRIESPKGALHLPQVQVSDDAAKVGPVDVVMFAVKLYDVEAAVGLLPPLLGEGPGDASVVIPFQNGVETVDLLVRSVGRPHVAGGTATVSAVIAEPGVIRHTALDEIVFGELDGARSERLGRFLDACTLAGFKATLSLDIQVAIWTKFVRLAAFSAVTTWARCPIGTIRDDPELWDTWTAAVRETILVARAKGIALAEDIFEDSVARVQAMPAGTKSSMLEDLERGRPLELPWLSGAVVRLGREAGVDVPVHRGLAKALRPYMRGGAGR